MSGTAVGAAVGAARELIATRNRFIELVVAGHTQPEYLARHVWPDLFEAIPALAVIEAEKYLAKIKSGEMKLEITPIVTSGEDGDSKNQNEGVRIVAKKKKKSEQHIPLLPPQSPPAEETKKPRRGRPAKLKQTNLPGVESDSIPEIEEAAEEYTRIRDERMELTEEETGAQAKLLELMRKHKLGKYKFDGKIVAVIEGEMKVKVKKAKDPTEG